MYKPLAFAFALTLAAAACGGGHSSTTTVAGPPGPQGGPGQQGPQGPQGPGQPVDTSTHFALQGGGELIINQDGTGTFEGNAISPSSMSARFSGASVLAGNNLVVERMGSATSLRTADFGAWYVPNGPLTAINFYAAGQGGPTAGANLPVNGQVGYSGTYVGLTHNPMFGTNGPVSGPMSVTADFGTLAVTTTFSGPITENGGPVTSSGLMNKAQGTYTAATQPPLQSQQSTITAQGAFYGSGASETAGTFSGTDGRHGTPISGSFGAHR